MATIRRHLPEVRNCYEEALKKEPRTQGALKLRFTIIPKSGKVRQTLIKSNSTGSKAMARCVEQVVAAWTFPASSGTNAIVVDYPFEFSKPDAAIIRDTDATITDAAVIRDLADARFRKEAALLQLQKPDSDIFPWETLQTPVLPCEWPPQPARHPCALVLAQSRRQDLTLSDGTFSTEAWGAARVDWVSRSVDFSQLAASPKSAIQGHRPVSEAEAKKLGLSIKAQDLLVTALKAGALPSPTDQQTIRDYYHAWLTVTATPDLYQRLGKSCGAFLHWLEGSSRQNQPKGPTAP